GRVCIERQLSHVVVERLRLPEEKPHVREEGQGSHCDAIRICRSNDRASRQASADKRTRLWHYQVRLELLAPERWRIQVRKRDYYTGFGIGCSQRWCITSLIRPSLKVHCFGRADADQDTQDLHVVGPLRQRGVEAVTTLFNGWKVEPCRIGHCLNEVFALQIGVCSRNCRMLPNEEAWDGLRKDEAWIQVRIVTVIAVARPPAGIERQLRQICKPFPDHVGVNSGGSAARQLAKRI